MPRQLPNATHAHPRPQLAFSTKPCDLVHYGVLVGVSTGYPPVAGRLHTRYAPVRRSPAAHCWAPLPLDLHVLSLPLAFILSQDQTLHCKNCLLSTFDSSRVSASRPRLKDSDTRYLIFPIVSMSFCLQGASLFHCRSPVESGCKDTTIFQNTKIFFRFFRNFFRSLL